jgi:fluoroquinolone resistance protein
MSFHDENYFQQTFIKLSLEGEVIKTKTFEECIFEDCRFLDCSFEKSRFLNCCFNGCVISVVNVLGCRFVRPIFLKCKVMGIDWTKTMLFREPEFRDSKIDFSNFRMLKMSKAKIVNCEAKETEFTETDFTEAVFTGTNFEKGRFFKTNLTRADFRGARNYNIDIINNTITKAKFSYPEAASLLLSLDISIE